ncbi:MAG: type II secretion system protein [Candidatus Moranbacteria bacterium]|nr:type II secretion system protein [Candidatus Moranbacteria bacterium]
MKIKIKTKKGFTLLEVMAVMGIVAVMTAVALSAIVNSRNRTELESAANEVMAAIRETQNYALTGKRDGSNDVCTGYKFTSDVAESNRYVISGEPSTCNFFVGQKLSGGVTFSGGSLSIEFTTPHADMIPSGTTIIITLIKGGHNYCVFINNAGLITKGQCP